MLRTNCIDCLDRTNVVQGWIARKQLEKFLLTIGALQGGQTLPTDFPTVRTCRLPGMPIVCHQSLALQSSSCAWEAPILVCQKQMAAASSWHATACAAH